MEHCYTILTNQQCCIFTFSTYNLEGFDEEYSIILSLEYHHIGAFSDVYH